MRQQQQTKIEKQKKNSHEQSEENYKTYCTMDNMLKLTESLLFECTVIMMAIFIKI